MRGNWGKGISAVYPSSSQHMPQTKSHHHYLANAADLQYYFCPYNEHNLEFCLIVILEKMNPINLIIYLFTDAQFTTFYWLIVIVTQWYP